MSDPYNSNGLPDPVRPDRPASARPIDPRRHRKLSVGEFFERWIITWNVAGLGLSLVLAFSGRNQGSLGGLLFMAWPFLMALAVRFWITNSVVCLVARGFTALWGLFLVAQFLRYSMYGITTPKTLMLLTMAVLLGLNAMFLKPAPQRD
jgi:hypothetical protein